MIHWQVNTHHICTFCKKLINLFSRDKSGNVISSTSNKCCSFELSIQPKILKKYITKIWSSTTIFGFDNNKKAANHHIRLISKGSYDTKDWSNGWWKSSFAITGINCFKMYSNRNAYFQHCIDVFIKMSWRRYVTSLKTLENLTDDKCTWLLILDEYIWLLCCFRWPDIPVWCRRV